MAPGDQLPHVDEHSIAIAAPDEDAWEALLRVVEASFDSRGSAIGARLLSCEDTHASGPRPLATGSTLPGFRVEAAVRPRKLAPVGGHRFSGYALIFRLGGESDDRTTLRAETRAQFPGIKGRAYRAMVIGTRMHVLVTRRLLTATKRRAESSSANR